MTSAREDDGGLTRHRSNSSKAYSGPAERTTGNPLLMDDEEKFSRDTGRRWTGQASTYSQYSPRKPLIDYCTNEWKQDKNWTSQQNAADDRFEDALEKCLERCLAILKAPKIRRYLLFYTVVFVFSIWLWQTAVWPMWLEHRALTRSLSAQNTMMAGGTFGSNLRPTFPNVVQVKDLDPKYLPRGSATQHPKANAHRLIFVGDVHGCLDELKALMTQVGFDSKRDHLITTGDLIAKGPDSRGTIDYIRKLGASCVRGNHEDRILLIAQDLSSNLLHLESPGENGDDNLDEQSFSRSDSPDRILAASLSAEQIAYLESCPVILRVGFIKPLAGDLVVAHAGLVPGVSLERQDPTAVMSMRSIDLDTHVPSKEADSEGGVPWFKLWNKYQKSLPMEWSLFPASDSDAQKAKEHHTTVIYGHDARKGLQIKQYSKGIDTACVRGGKLTALIMGDGGGMDIVQVICKDHRKRRPLKVDVEDILLDGKVGDVGDEP
jgi:Calcineurin-like phosphoesterase